MLPKSAACRKILTADFIFLGQTAGMRTACAFGVFAALKSTVEIFLVAVNS